MEEKIRKVIFNIIMENESLKENNEPDKVLLLQIINENLPEYKDVLFLKYFHKLSFEEISKQLNIPKINVQTLFAIGDNKLKRELRTINTKKIHTTTTTKNNAYFLKTNLIEPKTTKQRLKKVRIELGLGINDVAEKLGIRADVYGDFEKNNSTPKKSTLEKICNALNIKLAFLFDINTEINLDTISKNKII